MKQIKRKEIVRTNHVITNLIHTAEGGRLRAGLLMTGVLWAAVTLSGCAAGEKPAMAEPYHTAGETEAGMEQGGMTQSGNDMPQDAGAAKSGKEEETPSEVSGNDTETGADTQREQAAVRREPVKVKGIYVSGPAAGSAGMDDLIQLVEDTELNAMVIDVKNDEGLVTYKMQTKNVLETGSGTGYIRDIGGLVEKCREKGIYLIARIVAFKDPYLAEHRPELSVRTQSGEIFRDKSGLAWVNPYRTEVWEYLLEIASEAAAVGFDEIQFDYIRFSTDLKADQLDFGEEAEEKDKIEVITEFTQYACEILKPLGVYVSADVYGTVIDNPVDQKIVGQDYVSMAQSLDYISPMIYPSHYGPGSYGIAVPDAKPYDTILAALKASRKALEEQPEEACAKVRPWLQNFTAGWVDGHIRYGPDAIRKQIDAVYAAGYEEWILWNASMHYQQGALLPAEAASESTESIESTESTEETVTGNEGQKEGVT